MKRVSNALYYLEIKLNVQVIKERRGITAFTGIATVNGEVACEAKLMCARR